MTMWQPIETAPEGEDILCYWGNGEMQVGQIWQGKWLNEWIPESEKWSMPDKWMPRPAEPAAYGELTPDKEG